MARKTGLAALTTNNLNQGIPRMGLQLDNLIQAVRVKSIVLDETHPRFQELGEWNGLGAIEFNPVDNPLPAVDYPVAYPLNARDKNFPLINEIVYILSLPDTSIGDFTSGTRSYYIDSVSIWNHPHHNAYPAEPNNLPNSQQKDYVETEAGSVRRVTDQSTEIRLGKTFKERTNIHPLLPFEGDIIYEGRWGQSIRFGSTNYQKIGGNKTVSKSNSFSAREEFGFGVSNPQSINSQLSVLSSKVRQFANKYDNVTITTTIKASESQVTNPNNIPPGKLAKQRLENTLSILLSYPLINKDIRSQSIIGSTSYTRGVDNPNDPKYLAEQYVSISVSVRGTETTSDPESGIPLNAWSKVGNSGDPILILRNGQGEQSEEGWIPIVENINNSDSSIYLTSTQLIPLQPSTVGTLSKSYPKDIPVNVDEYAGKQIILNSGRLVFNSNEDHILLSSNLSIGLKAVNGINIDTNGYTIINSPDIKLGSKDATEPILKGDTTINLLSQLVQQLTNLTIALKTVTPSAGPAVAPAATTLEPLLRQLKTSLETQTKSTVSKTI